MNHGKIQQKFLVSIITILVVSLLLGEGMMYYASYREVSTRLEKISTELSIMARDNLARSLLSLDYSQAEVFADSLFLFQAVAFVEIRSLDEVIYARTSSGLSASLAGYKDSSEYSIKYQDIVWNGDRIGKVSVVVSRTGTWGIFQSESYLTLALLMVSLCVMAFVVIRMTRKYIFSPLMKLTLAAERVSKGDLSTSVIIKDGDEFTVFADTFSDMVRNLRVITASRDELNIEIARRVAAEERLLQEHRRVQRYLDLVGVAMMSLDPQGRVMMVNRKCCDIFECDPEDLLGKSWFKEFLEPATCTEFGPRFQAVMSGEKEGVASGEIRVRTFTGDVRLIAWQHALLSDESGNISELLCSGQDITADKEREQQRLLSKKLESIGQLAAGIAHEINTPTQYIESNLHFLKDVFGDILVFFESGEKLIEESEENDTESVEHFLKEFRRLEPKELCADIPSALQDCLFGVERVAEIVASVKQLAHPGGEEMVLSDLNESVQSAVTVSTNAWKYVADLDTAFDDSLPKIPLLRGEFNQAVLNLVVNAAQAIGSLQEKSDEAFQKGRIIVQTKHCGNHAEVIVSDDGPGVPEGIVDRIFDPFFTTKPVGEGTGQGLSLSRSIVEKHGGTLDVGSYNGRGAQFIISIPFG